MGKPMQLISVNVGQKAELQNGSRLETTGIYKIPTGEPIKVTAYGLENDFIFSTKHHGGPDQAVYIYGGLDYDWWSKELGRIIVPGTFGENLTISGLESAKFSIGDRLQIGDVVLEVSSPRIPCATLAARMGDPKFVKLYRQAERPGLYCRVIQIGIIQVGAAVRIIPILDESVPLLELFRGYYEKNKSEAVLQRQLRAPIAIRVRVDLEQELRQLIAK